MVCGGLSLLATGCAKQFNNIGDQQQTVPAPVITNVVYDQAMNITGNNFDSLLSQVNVGGQLASGFTFRKDPSTGVETLHNQLYRTPTGLDNPDNITVTVNGKISNAWSYLFYPAITGFAPDSAIGNAPITISGVLFGSRTVPSSVKAFYYDGNFAQVYMSPDPTVVSWTTNAIQVTMPVYTTYPTGRPLLSFQIYLEVDVSTKNDAQEVQYFR